MSKKLVNINVPYFVEIIEKTGMSREAFSKKVLLRSNGFASGLIFSGKTHPSTAEAIVRVTNCDKNKLLQKVDYNPEDYRLKAKQGIQKDGTISQYIALMSDASIEMAKNQKQVSELMILVSNAQIQHKKKQEETDKILEQLLLQINAIGKKVDEIYRELK